MLLVKVAPDFPTDLLSEPAHVACVGGLAFHLTKQPMFHSELLPHYFSINPSSGEKDAFYTSNAVLGPVKLYTKKLITENPVLHHNTTRNSEVLGKGEAESKRGEAEPTSSPRAQSADCQLGLAVLTLPAPQRPREVAKPGAKFGARGEGVFQGDCGNPGGPAGRLALLRSEKGLPSGAPARPPLARPGLAAATPPPPTTIPRVVNSPGSFFSLLHLRHPGVRPGDLPSPEPGSARSSNLAQTLCPSPRCPRAGVQGSRRRGGRRPAARLPGRFGVGGKRKRALSPSFKGGEISCSGAIPRGGWLPAGVACPCGGSELLRELTPGKLGVSLQNDRRVKTIVGPTWFLPQQRHLSAKRCGKARCFLKPWTSP
eukprot:bmy_07951T0